MKVSCVLLLWVTAAVPIAISTVSLFSRCISNIQDREKWFFLFFSESCLGWGESKLGNGERRTESVLSHPWQVLVDVLHSPCSSSVPSVPGVRRMTPNPDEHPQGLSTASLPEVPQSVL